MISLLAGFPHRFSVVSSASQIDRAATPELVLYGGTYYFGLSDFCARAVGLWQPVNAVFQRSCYFGLIDISRMSDSL